MVYVKLIRNTYGGTDYLRNCCVYPAKQSKKDSRELCGYGTYGVDLINPENAYHQMRLIKIYYGKEFNNPLIHYIVSYDGCVKSADKACNVTQKISEYFTESYQLIWAVHHRPREESDYHAHIILNSVNYKNGMMYHSDIGEIKRFCYHVRKVTGRDNRFCFI